MPPDSAVGYRETGPRLPRPVAAFLSRLPQLPHSVALAIGLNLFLGPLLSEETRNALRGRVIAIRVEDAGIDFRVRLGTRGFAPLTGRHAPEVTIRAAAWDFYQIARRIEDPDTLFFSRRLVMEGDTALGLEVKNALDAIDWQSLPAPIRTVLEKGAASARRFRRK